ncbi:MAG: hypothetical protein NWE88_11240 [Candidatus Bathyarchaeota archaeon]|nr:hypothetical protein [Candidatus Bathyarchaeota archaeon]
MHVNNWKQFKLIVTDPSKSSLHFDLVKHEIIPFVNELDIRFWVTNYRNPKEDYILFRVDVSDEESQMTAKFLNELKTKKRIVNWIPQGWKPEVDARKRIESACQKIEISGIKIPSNFRDMFITEERVKQLTAIFEDAVGPCTKILYETLFSRPNEPWMMSVFFHLVLNAIDMSGPDPPSEEDTIRKMPPV